MNTNAIIKKAIEELVAQKQTIRASAYSQRYAELKPQLDADLKAQNEKLNKAIDNLNAGYNATKEQLNADYNDKVAKIKAEIERRANEYADTQSKAVDVKIAQLEKLVDEGV